MKIVAVGRADGLADADLADALGDAGEHDVHDADAADEQADGRDDAAAHARVADGGGDVLRPVLLGPEGEILDALVRVHQDVAGLLQRRFQRVDVGHSAC